TQGADFVRKYLQYVIGDLEGDIRLYKRATESDSGEIRQFAQNTLPVLESNLAKARQVWEQQVAEEPAPAIETR
ncbi:MAG TPA: DUF4142 domain-containing protein, partial [Candidatus Omnitrophota bacterium]|nr:DUF4142 domain-containing protein [Candidatus Omnitrophota bacterium]